MIKPTRGYVLIEPMEPEEMTAAGVYLPDRVKDMPQKGKVLAVGAAIDYKHDGHVIGGWSELQPEMKEGNIIIFKRFIDNKIKEEGKELFLIKFEDILGVYE